MKKLKEECAFCGLQRIPHCKACHLKYEQMQNKVALPNTNLYLDGYIQDGKRQYFVCIGKTRVYSIRISGSLPRAKSILNNCFIKEIKQLNENDLSEISQEAISFIMQYGSILQKERLQIYHPLPPTQ